ncbi:hypothetical protein ACTI_71250 [Actinoplanes sp. OR16]|uniref:discoidin domain-containing protein n=1 Tax=Actinoplanes sp. OR16 TaxID=946334 RepID=UPI000F6F322E|nr:discoidin domain-containing protein [Actinoplanes sp. OR16]BBH70440.1 hypothetical protein ACTI_71250 [Actinoplanes sp. OR16]
MQAPVEQPAPDAVTVAGRDSRRRVRTVAGVVVALLAAGGGAGYAYNEGWAGESTRPAPTRQAGPVGVTSSPSAPVTASVPPIPVSSPEPVASPTAPRRSPSASPSASPAPAGRANPRGVNLALGGAVTASAAEGDPWLAKYAVDGDPATRWSSGFSDPQWIRVDLGERWQLSEVTLDWEAAYGVAYRVDSSLDGRKWTPIYATEAGKGGSVTVSASGQVARYVRMYGTKRNSSYGYSLLEFEVR